jgi:hypothetical protein
MRLGSLQSGSARSGFLRGITRYHELVVLRAFCGWPVDDMVQRVFVLARGSTREQPEMCWNRHRIEVLIERTAQLEAANTQPHASYGALADINRAMVGHELRMIELKRQVNDNCPQAGPRPRYDLDCEKGRP